MSKNQKIIVFSLDNIFVETEDILLNTFKKYFCSQFPDLEISMNISNDLNILQLMEQVKLKSYLSDKFKKSDIPLGSREQKVNLEYKKHIRKINDLILGGVDKCRVLEKNIEYLRELFQDSGSQLALYSIFDSHITFKLIQKLNISNFFKVIVCRNDLSLVTAQDGLFEHMGIFFNQDPGELYYCSENKLIIDNAKRNGLTPFNFTSSET